MVTSFQNKFRLVFTDNTDYLYIRLYRLKNSICNRILTTMNTITPKQKQFYIKIVVIKWFFTTLDFVKHYIKTEMMFWRIYATTIKFEVQDRTDYIRHSTNTVKILRGVKVLNCHVACFYRMKNSKVKSRGFWVQLLWSLTLK